MCKSTRFDGGYTFGNGEAVGVRLARGINEQRRLRGVIQNAVSRTEIGVVRYDLDGGKRRTAEKCRAVYRGNACGKRNGFKSTVAERFGSDAFKTAVFRKGKRAHVYRIEKSLRADFFHTVRNIRFKKPRAVLESGTPDVDKSLGKCYAAQTGLIPKRFVTDGGYNLSVDFFGDRNKAALSGITAYFNRSVVQFDIGIRHTVFFVRPVCIQCDIGVPRIFVQIQFFGAVDVVIPSVKNRIISFGERNVL